MRYAIVVSLFMLLVAAGCGNKQTSFQYEEAFSTEKAAVHHFLQEENPWNVVEKVVTVENNHFYIVRSGGYSVYGIAHKNGKYAVVKLTPTLAGEAGGAEFTASNEKDLTFYFTDDLDKLNISARSNYAFHPILSDRSYAALSEGHTLEGINQEMPVDVIQSTETVQ